MRVNYSEIGKQVMSTTVLFKVEPEKVLEQLPQDKGITANSLAEEMGVKYTDVMPVLTFLHKAGMVNREKGSKPEGKRGKAPYLYRLK